MIISASRRTDIPAFYSDWLLNRLRAGFALVQSPVNPHFYSRINLGPGVVDCLVFWTKNPANLLGKLDAVTSLGHKFYFQFTLTPYGPEVESGLPPKDELIETFKRLSKKIGPEKVVWRCDPIILGGGFDVDYHLHNFSRLAHALSGYTERCTISFLDFYRNIKKPLEAVFAREIKNDELSRLADGFSKTAAGCGMELLTCAEPVDLGRFGIGRASCIDKGLIEKIIGCPIDAKKDQNQRPACGCIESVDIGAYGCCPHGCVYCYANRGRETALRRAELHDPESPALIGAPKEGDVVKEREARSLKISQLSLFK